MKNLHCKEKFHKLSNPLQPPTYQKREMVCKKENLYGNYTDEITILVIIKQNKKEQLGYNDLIMDLIMRQETDVVIKTTKS